MNLAELKLDKSVQFILRTQLTSGAIPWYTQGKLDPWDHIEAAMALSIAQETEAAVKAYDWLAQNQLTDGSWLNSYFHPSENNLKETNFIAYFATGIWHHYLITKDISFLRRYFPAVEKAINFVLRCQSSDGEIAWATTQENIPEPDALITACASTLRSLECAYHCAKTLGIQKTQWQHAWLKLRDTLLHKPYRFDRTWESKARFSMDWFYPVLSGMLDPNAARARLNSRWGEFVQPTLGCRCVSDEPWVTIAETAELCMALVASEQRQQAETLFHQLFQWQDDDGGFWTGYVFRDKTIWPQEKTAWTAGAMILAADAIFQLSPAANLFTQMSVHARNNSHSIEQLPVS